MQFAMKKLTPILGAAGLALASLTANAQAVFQYNDGDLVLDFSRSGSSDLEVNIGNISQFTGQAAGTTVGVNGYSVNNQLLATFGNLNSLQFGVIGTQNGSGSSYLSLRRTDPNVQNAAPSDFTFSRASTVNSDINGIIGNGTARGILPFSAGNPANAVGNTATAVVIPTTGAQAVNSFSTIYNGTGGLRSALPSPGVLNTTDANFSGTSGAIAVLDLFQYDGAGTGAKATYLGDFTLLNDGSFTFTAVPEPSSYALLAGFGVLALALRRRFVGAN